MPQEREEVRHRLQEAALEPYRARGYDETATAQMAEQAVLGRS